MHGTLFFLVLFALFTTNSRSGMAAWLGAFAGVVMLSLIKPIYSKKWLLLVGLGSACIYGLVMYLPIWFGEASMIRGLEDIAHLNHRTYIWGATWELIKAMPINGYGLGTFSNLYAAERYEYGSSGVFVHNDYLQLLLEGGPVLLGLLLAYVAFLYLAWPENIF